MDHDILALATPLERVAKTPYTLFENKMYGKPLILIYPRHRARTAFVAMFLQHYAQNIIYYALNQTENSLIDWLTAMTEDPALALDQTHAALQDKGSPQDLAAAFGADLAAQRAAPYMLLVDMFDHLNMDRTAERFFRALPEHMPDGVQVIISARLLGRKPWNELLHAGYLEVVGNEHAINGGIYGDEIGRGQLEVYALEGGRVYIDGRPVTRWDGSLPRHLFYYFIDHTMVTRDEIFSIFWPNMGIKEATNVFHVTKRKISERLGHELTNYSSGFYVPAPNLTVHYDVRLFEEALTTAMDGGPDAPHLWYQAVQLYRSDFLPYVTKPWVEERRATLQQKYAQALINLGRYYRGLGELDRALGFLLTALHVKPDWEDVHQDVMMIYHQEGRKEDAVAQYHRLEATLRAMFNIAPTENTRRVFEVIAAS